MKKAKLFGLGLAALGMTVALAACGSKSEEKEGTSQGSDYSIAMVTDTGGVDDRSFNQSAWEGMQAWGKEHDLEQGQGGFMYFQSSDASDYATNIDQALASDFQTIYGIGYLLQDSIEAAAATNPDTNFVIVDSVIEDLDNVASVTFKDHEAAYLAGIAAGYTTKTNKVGFIGGEEGVVIDRFQAGFEKGVADAAEELGKDISVDVQYAASFSDSSIGLARASAMYQSGVDVIFHASGAVGQGVFQEAKNRNESGENDKVWVIGVDSDQEEDGKFTNKKTGEADNCTLTSTLKGVGTSVQDIANRVMEGNFPGGEHLAYGLADNGVDLTDGFLSDEAKEAVAAAKERVITGDVEVPEKPE